MNLVVRVLWCPVSGGGRNVECTLALLPSPGRPALSCTRSVHNIRLYNEQCELMNTAALALGIRIHEKRKSATVMIRAGCSWGESSSPY